MMRTFITMALIGGLVATSAIADHELSRRDLDNGRSAYIDQCASCHGENLQGQPDWKTADEQGVLPAPPHDETGHTWHHDNQLLFDYTRQGGAEALAARGITGVTSGMPPFAGILSDDDIWDVLAYIRSTWPKRIQEMQASRNPPHDP